MQHHRSLAIRMAAALLGAVAPIFMLPSLLSAQVVPLGAEFQVNSHTASQQAFPAVAVGGTGDFVVTWQDGSYSYGIFGQRYASTGGALGTEFQINSYTAAFHSNPTVASAGNGDFVVLWDSAYGQDGDAFGVFGQRYASSGNAVGTEFQVNTYTRSNQAHPSVVTDANGDFVAVWESDGQDGNNFGVFGQRYASDGSALGTEFHVNTYTMGTQDLPRVAAAASGDFVVMWESYGDGSTDGVFGQRYASSGDEVGTEFQVNTYTMGEQERPAVVVGGNGDFVATWHSFGQDGDSFGVFGQRYASSGSALGTEFQVNTQTSSLQQVPAVAYGSDGDFVVVWLSGGDGSGLGIFGRHYASSGSPVGTEFQVNSYTTNSQSFPAIAADGNGDFVVVWHSYQDGDGLGIFGQRLVATPGSADTATPTPTPTAVGACPANVDGGCTTGFAKGGLLIKEDVAGKEKLVAKMVKGPALAQTALGNPLNNGGTVYSLCVYDDVGNLAGGVGSSVVVDRAGDTCGSVPCWASVGGDPPGGKGYKYLDGALAADGVLKILYKGGDAGKSKVIVKGKGPNLPNGIPAALQTTTFATLQLRASDGQCLSVAVNDIKKQEAGSFKAK